MASDDIGRLWTLLKTPFAKLVYSRVSQYQPCDDGRFLPSMLSSRLHRTSSFPVTYKTLYDRTTSVPGNVDGSISRILQISTRCMCSPSQTLRFLRVRLPVQLSDIKLTKADCLITSGWIFADIELGLKFKRNPPTAGTKLAILGLEQNLPLVLVESQKGISSHTSEGEYNHRDLAQQKEREIRQLWMVTSIHQVELHKV